VLIGFIGAMVWHVIAGPIPVGPLRQN